MPRALPKTTLRGAAVGCALVVAAASVWALSDIGIQDLPLGRTSPSDTMAVTVVLPTADGITIGADVRNGQKVVGRVSGMSLAASGASVQLSLADADGLDSGTVASVELPSALGNPFVRLSSAQLAPQRALRDGDVIPPSHTELGPQIESALATFGALLSRSGVDQLATIVTELDKAFAGRADKVRGLIDSMSLLAAKASDHQGEFDQAMSLAANIAGQFGHEQKTVAGYLDAVPKVVAMLDVQRAKLQTLFSSTTALAATADSVLSSTDLNAMVSDAGTVVQTMGAFNDRLGGMLTAMNNFLEKFGSSVHGDYLMFDGALDIPGTIDKLLTGGLIVNGTPITGDVALEGFLSGGLN
ncbi:MlaD family protein [Mycolicibacterium peregrinum]|uniref:Mammalian cell entry protein n=1 Tax=Mycolicibacterium peregrinum TaxID=43304 RepID=A0A4Z0HV97_MYCPR|nr:MlaD family protein [Mycolicibacterium peregrinum]TGB44740.1 mammalian cell entry protein [Mycolicibacterium peregrinum]TGB46849.1 mammalian cell entry protein [Mycolicibacterium peregrinum]